MRLGVLTQRSLVAETLLAEITLERLHFDVRLITVVLQRLTGKVFGAAFLADETLLHFGVHSHMPLQIRFERKRFFAVFATVFLGVCARKVDETMKR